VRHGLLAQTRAAADSNLVMSGNPTYFPPFDLRVAAHRQPLCIDLIEFFLEPGTGVSFFSSTL
jgi:hypothetical protein